MTSSRQDETRTPGKRRPTRGPRRITPSYLENAALFYLGRYATSTAHFRRILMNKVRRSARFHGTDIEEGEKIVEDLIRRYRKSGLLDDNRYAEAKARHLHGRGMALRGIQAKLREKGIEADAIEEAVSKLRESTARPDLAAAAAYVRRRRFGPYRPPENRSAHFKKDLAALGRSGFSYGIARQVLEVASVDALEALLAEEEI
ncbi:MAG: RecX family transcriptional regulator [Alphaproteobacteria bacterium]|nr:RecX family transcriptional regulator [Alphaproteobacteria bacterium]